jgi:hypothetical protein
MAAATIFAGLLRLLMLAPVEAQTASSESKADSKRGESATRPPTYVVKLDLKVAGVGRQGCDVEIKPGNGGCKFKPVTYHLDSTGRATLKVKDIETQSADRDCTFAITIHEPGHTERTVKRGLRLKRPGDPGHTLDCFLSSPSKIAQAEQEGAAKR